MARSTCSFKRGDIGVERIITKRHHYSCAIALRHDVRTFEMGMGASGVRNADLSAVRVDCTLETRMAGELNVMM